MNHYDVIVVGAGPAGSSCARTIAENSDKEIALVEQGEEPDATGAGGVGAKWLEDMNMKLPDHVIRKAIHKVKIHSPNSTATLSRDDLDVRELGYVIDRQEFDKWLNKRAFYAGDHQVKGGFGAKVVSVNQEDGKYKAGMEFKDGGEKEMTSNFIVDASGPNAVVGHELGFDVELKPRDIHIGYQYKTVLPIHMDPNTIQMWFDSEKIPHGYVWSFPDSQFSTRLGIGVDQKIGDPQGYLEQFVLDHNEFANEVAGETGGLIPTGVPKETAKGNAFLVGDAGRFCSPLHGGGIYFGIVTGREAGKAIADDRSGAYYERRWKKRIWKTLQRHYKLKDMLYSFNNDQLGRLFSLFDEYDIQSIDLLKEIPRAMSYVLRKDPKLVGSSLKKYFLG